MRPHSLSRNAQDSRCKAKKQTLPADFQDARVWPNPFLSLSSLGMSRSQRSPVYLIALGAFALGMASYVTAGLIPMIEEAFSVPVAIVAQLVTAFTLAYGLGSPI